MAADYVFRLFQLGQPKIGKHVGGHIISAVVIHVLTTKGYFIVHLQ